jgi:FKBP-type peptidyl-prolyl cis-trans isomerase (trigger factor)
VAVEDPVENGDVVKLSFADPKNPGELRQVYANVGKDFDDMEVRLPGLCVGGQVKIPYAGKEVEAQILAVKRLQVPALTDAHVAQLGIAQVADLAQFEEHLFGKLAEGQRKRKFRGIMGIVSKAMMENTEFEDLEGHPWYQALHNHMMGRVEAFAAQAGLSAEAALPAALRMDGKSLEECRQALKAMCIERARQGAMGQHYAQENGVTFPEMDTADLVGEYVDYLNQVVYQHFAPMVQVSRP